uniref:Tudor domain-containing protein n=1 Tax=Monopterus albus TaxID=43700 RepID=A0A3Q3IIP8_MONAL
MRSMLSSDHQKSQDSGPPAPCALWPLALKITHLDWNPDATLIHFQGQYLSICELDYNILQVEIQSTPKTKAAVDIGEFCVVEDLTSGHWYRGRVQNRKEDMFDVFLIDHGNVLSVDITHIYSCSNDLFILPPKIVCGFLANVLLLQSCSLSLVEEYFSRLLGSSVTGYIQAFLPHKILLLEAPDINSHLVRHGFGRHVDTDTFLLMVEMLTEVPLKQSMEPIPDLLIEKPRGQEFCFKPSSLQEYEKIMSFCGSKLSCGTHTKVRVTAAVSPGLFYCQMASMETDLLEMSKKLAAVCEDRTKERSQKTEPENLGLLCSVKDKDEKWYRGFVPFLPVNSQVRVLFIDYGFFEFVKVENIHRLPPDFYSAPIMAFPCSLSCLSGQDEAFKTQQLSFLKAGLLGGVLDVEISNSDEEKHLYSITVIGAENDHIKELEHNQELQEPRVKSESVFKTEKFSPQGGCLYYETFMAEELNKTLKAEEVEVNSVFVGYVVYVENPTHFWIRTQKRNDEFEELMTEIADHFRQVKLEEDVLLNPELGTLCCAVHEEDMNFYRGVVTHTLEHGAEVLFIDFGNIEKVPHVLIKKIPDAFASKSAFAICCSLVKVLPLDDVWTSTASDFFRRAVSNKDLLVHVVDMRINKIIIDLYEVGSDSNQSITELLISSKQAEYCKNTSIEPVRPNNTARTEQRCLSYSVTDISGNKEQWDKKENKCKNDTEMSPNPASFKALSIKPGHDLAVCCSYIDSPSDFWCRPLDKGPALEELMDRVAQYYTTHTVPLQSGDSCCVANSPLDEKWYRAFITEIQDGIARVLLVDYGYTIQIKENNLQAIMPEYLSLEGQAFRCSLYNLIEPADLKNCGDWSQEARKLLKDFVFDSTRVLRCKVVSQLNVKNKGLCNVVDLYNTQTQQSIAGELVEQGLAREVTVSTKPLSAVFPESFVYSSYNLNPGNEVQVFVTHVNSQWDVYCQLERNTKIIEDLEKKISEESEKMMQTSTRAVVRKLCLAKYLDGKWYRGLAHPVQSPLYLRVFFVDYGNTNISEKNQVMFIPRDTADLLYTPMQAVRCSLASVSKEELYAGVKDWLVGAVLNKEVRAVIVAKSEDGSFDVELFDGDVNINQKVKDLILSLSSKSQPKEHSSKFPICNPDRRTQVRSAFRNKKENRKYATWKAPNKNTQAERQNQDKTKSPVLIKPQKNPKVKQRVYQDINTKSEQPQTDMPQFSCLPEKRVSAGFRAKCFVSHIDTVKRFFLQLSDDESAILKMGEDLNSDVFIDSLKATTSLRISDIVLAEYEEDGALYRCVVKGCEGSSRFKVEFIDYGNSASVGKDKIYSIPKDYLTVPRFSISCFLLDTSVYENDASFTDAVVEKPLMVDFVRVCGTQWEVKVEILGGEVGFPPALEATEGSPVNKKEEEPPASSTETEKKAISCDQNYRRTKVCKNEKTKSKKMMPTVQGKNIMLKPPSVTLSTKMKVRTCKRCRTIPTRIMTVLKINQRKTSKFPSKAVRDLAGVFTALTIQAEDMENGTILSVKSNCEFYIRLARTSDLFSGLESCIADNLNKCEMLAKEDIRQGLHCLVQEDNKWHRALVQQVEQDECQVLFVDQGITEDILIGPFRRQCSELSEIPSFAVLCKLNCLGFSESMDANRLWNQTLASLTGKEVKLLFVHYSEADKLWMVELVKNELFLIQQITNLPQDHQHEASVGEPNTDTSSLQQLPFAPVDTDKAYFGFAAAVTTPFEFCVVLEDLLLIMTKVSMMLDDLPGQVSPLPEAHLIPGACCLLKSDSKNKWCRAEIVNADATVVVNLVDYGHCECLSYKDRSKLKRLPEELMNLPKSLYQKNLQILFREFVSNIHWKVDILAAGVYVAKELVDAGHASYVDAMLGLRFQEQITLKAPLQDLDSEEESGQEDEDAKGKSDLFSQGHWRS